MSVSVHFIWGLWWTVDGYHRFGGTYCAHLQARRLLQYESAPSWNLDSYMPCARTHPPVGRYLCSVGEERSGLFDVCLFTRRRTCIYYRTTYAFFLDISRGLMKLVAAIGKAVCLISVYKSQWTWISAMGVIGLVMEVRVPGTPFTRLDGLWFLLFENKWIVWFVTGKRRQVMTSYGVSWTVYVTMHNRYEITWKANDCFQTNSLVSSHCGRSLRIVICWSMKTAYAKHRHVTMAGTRGCW
jgi:hypothetical protein